jgi:pseudaminic acid biosynthesis-associated methylase
MYQSDQELFWAGDFGNKYIDRNCSDKLLFSKVAMWAKMLRSASNLSSIKELGCNIGQNLIALNKLRPDIQLSGYEINESAAKRASDLGIANIVYGSILNELEDEPVDLTFTCGVLIHINPNNLDAVYRNLINGSRRYVLVAEYYNPSPVEIPYRGYENRLFKRDFAGELIDNFHLKLVDYGFFYKRDNCAPQDDITWFLLEK